MTPEQIEKEKADKIEKAKTINAKSVDTPVVEDAELSKSQPVNTAPPKESARQLAKKVGDYKRVVQMAGEKGVDMDSFGEMPLMDSDKGKITDAVKSAYGRELATGIQGISDSITAPKNEERNNLDVKALMALEKQKRRSKWSDALYAFGEGLQGKTANQDNFVSTKIQRNQDKQFQDYKDTTERNQKTKYLWENQSRKEMIDWADQESKNMGESENYREKMRVLSEKYTQDQINKDRGFKIQEQRNRISASKGNKPPKEDKKIKVQTSKQVHELSKEEYNMIKRDVLTNIDKYKDRYSNWFIEKPEMVEDNNGMKVATGKTTIELRPQIKEDELVGAYLEEQDNPLQPKVGSAAYFDKYRKQKGLSTAPASQDAKPQSQPKQTVKADPLGLGF